MKKVVYRYYCKYRPPMPGAIPRRGLVRVYSYDQRQSFDGIGSWGFAEYEEPLTEQEIRAYELAPSKNNPLEYDHKL